LWDLSPKIGWMISIDVERMVYTSINVKQFLKGEIEPMRKFRSRDIAASQSEYNSRLDALGLTRIKYQPLMLQVGDCIWANGTYARVYEIRNVPSHSCPDGETYVAHFQRLMLPSIGTLSERQGRLTYGWDKCNHLDATKITEEELEEGMNRWIYDTLPPGGILCPPK